MRCNKQELIAQASQTSHNFDHEGVLILRGKQDGFFRRSEGYSIRWFRLKGNLLFYLKGSEPWYEPLGVIVLGYHGVNELPQDENEHWPFEIVWDNGLCYRIAAFHELERKLWLRAIETASYEIIRTAMADLKEKLNNIRPSVDITDYRKQKGIIVEMSEVPLYELALSCDNLLCSSNGQRPSPMAVVYVKNTRGPYIKYATTEIVEKCGNPCFLKTVLFRASDDITGNTEVRILICDVREPVTETSLPMGFTVLKFGTIRDAQRLRVAMLTGDNKAVGFVTISGWSLEPPHIDASPVHVTTTNSDILQVVLNHRRSRSLPSRLGMKVKFPPYNTLFKSNFVKAHQVTYRFHSGLGGDINVHEIMAESKICFQLPIQLLDIYIQKEIENVQQLLSLGDICIHWKSRHTNLVNTHLALLKHYSHARQALEKIRRHHFKASSMKDDLSLEFAPVNLHLQRMWVINDTLNKTGFYDVITVGAFAAHSFNSEKNGGLIRLVQQLKDVNSPRAELSAITNKLQVENEKIVMLCRLRAEVNQELEMILLVLQSKQRNDLSAIIQTVVGKVGEMLTAWDPYVTEESLSLIGWQKDYRAEYKPVPMATVLKLIERVKTPNLVTLDPNQSSSFLNPVRSNSAPNDHDPMGPSTSQQQPRYRDPEGGNEDVGLDRLRFMRTLQWVEQSTALNAASCSRDQVAECSATFGQISYRSLMEIFNKENRIKNCEVNTNPFALPHATTCQLNQQTRDSNLSYFQTFHVTVELILTALVETLVIASDRQLNRLLTELELATIKEFVNTLDQNLNLLIHWLRVSHAAMRLRCESPQWMVEYASLQIRRDCCFSQALTAVTTGLMCWLCTTPNEVIVKILSSGLGPLCGFEGLLSLFGVETAMWGDMVVAIEDLHTVVFTLTRNYRGATAAVPNVTGTRNALVVYLPVSESLYSKFNTKEMSFTITAVFFNIGINDKATIAEAMGVTAPQYKSNCDNNERLNKYYQKYTKIFPNSRNVASRASSRAKPLEEVMENLNRAVHRRRMKNVDVIQLASLAARLMNGVSFTSCKSAKDRTGMAVTLAQGSILASEYHLADNEMRTALDVMRSEGCRRENTKKNIGIRKYAFDKNQVASLPEQYRPPAGTYGSSNT